MNTNTPRVGFISLGCPKALVDSELILTQLRAEGYDISRAQFDLLMTVAFEEGLNQQTCASQMMVTKGNITQHIDRLEERGLMRREKHGRTNSLYLTDAGRDLVSQIMPAHDERVKAILSLLSESELRDFQAVLRRLDRRLD